MRATARTMAALLFCLAWALASCGASERAGEDPPPPDQSSATEEMTGPTIRPGGEETADPGGASSQPSGGVGEAIALTGFDFRVLDYVSTPEYSYLEAANPDGTTEGEEGISAAGKFVVVTYTARNTGSAPTSAALSATLETESGEAYPEAETPKNPNSSGYTGLELAPRQLGTGQFIFDVPEDVEPIRLDVGIKYASGQLTGEGATVDLTRRDPQGPTPEEIMALGYTYINMGAWAEFYALLADESKQLVPQKQFVAFFESAEPTGVEGFSFPSVDVQGDRATVRTDFGTSTDGEESEQLTQELVLQEDGWRIVASDEQVEAFTGTVEATQY